MKPTKHSPSKPARVAPAGGKTVEQFLAELADADMTIADWARKHGHPLTTVYALCGKRFNGSRGASRKVARAMGLALPAIHPQAKEAA